MEWCGRARVFHVWVRYLVPTLTYHWMSSVLSFRKPSSNLELYLPDTCIVICIIHVLGFGLSLGLWCLTPLPTIFQLPVYTCKVLDDEIHFFLQWQINNNLRNVLINNIKKYMYHANFDQLDFFFPIKNYINSRSRIFAQCSWLYKAIVRIAKMRFTLVNV